MRYNRVNDVKMEVVAKDSSLFGRWPGSESNWVDKMAKSIKSLGRGDMLVMDVSHYGRPSHITSIISQQRSKGRIPKVCVHIEKKEKRAYIIKI